MHICMYLRSYIYELENQFYYVSRFGPWFMRSDPVEIAVEAYSQSVREQRALFVSACIQHTTKRALCQWERETDSEVCYGEL